MMATNPAYLNGYADGRQESMDTWEKYVKRIQLEFANNETLTPEEAIRIAGFFSPFEKHEVEE